MTENCLYFGDNLDILRHHIKDESVDLIYLDPPFNSNRAYNVIFQDKTGKKAAAQIQAFEDTWWWSDDTQAAYDEMLSGSYPVQLKEMLRAFREFMGPTEMMAYLTMMAIRLFELHRVLKQTGSLYLHCDPTASHYLKILLDQVFGIKNFINEVVWCYELGGRVSKRAYGRRHDTILFYAKSADHVFNWDKVLIDWDEKGKAKFKYQDEKGRYRLIGRFLKDSPIKGHRDVSPEWEESHPELVQRYYMKQGKAQVDFWNISPINQASPERIGYPTQKPLTLLERIIKASSNEGDVVLDPFCGCGTTIAAAEKLRRKWIGIDITFLAVALIKKRIFEHFPDCKFEIVGEPKSTDDAKALFKQSPFQFESWAVSFLGGQPYKSAGGGDTGHRRIPVFPGLQEEVS